jgi:hypothetical protein
MSRIFHSLWQRRLILLILAPLLLLVIRFALGYSWQTQGIHKSVDPFFYTSYIHDYRGLVEDFGVTYYSNRLAHILPSMVMDRLVGGWQGYQVYRVVLWLLAYWSIWALARQFRLSDFWCFVVAAGFVSHPWLTYSLFWDHYDSTAIVLLLWMMTGLTYVVRRAGELRNSYFIYWGSGVIYALVANCNSFLLGVGGVAWWSTGILLLLVLRFRKVTQCMIIGVSGFLVGYIALVWSANTLLPATDTTHYDLYSIGMTLNILGGGGEQWFMPLRKYMYDHHGWHVLLPLVLGTILSVIAVQKRFWRNPAHCLEDIMLAWFVIASLIGTILLYCGLHFVARTAVITLPFYFIYALPVSLIGLLLLLKEAQYAETGTFRTNPWQGTHLPMLTVLACCILLPICTTTTDYRILILLYILMVAATWTWIVYKSPSGRGMGKLALLGALLCFCSTPIFNVREYRAITGKYHRAYTRDLWEACRFIGSEIRHHKVKGESFAFWYRNGENVWNAVNSYFLWGYSRLQGTSRVQDGMPILTVNDQENLQRYRQIVLLGHDQDEIERGLDALREEGKYWETLNAGAYVGELGQYHYRLIRFID